MTLMTQQEAWTFEQLEAGILPRDMSSHVLDSLAGKGFIDHLDRPTTKGRRALIFTKGASYG